MTSNLYEVHFSKGKHNYIITLKMMAHIYHKYKIFMNYIWNLELRFECNKFWGFWSIFFLLLCSFVVYLGRISTKDPALTRLLYRNVPGLWGLHILQGCLRKLSELVQRCTCFKGLIYLELKEYWWTENRQGYVTLVLR